jgi:beta-glucosidase
VVSDCGAVTDIANGHHFAPSLPAAAAAALAAGTDLSCGAEYGKLVEAVNGGLIAEASLDRALVRLFTARFRLGMFDPPERVPYAAIPYSENDSAAHRVLALEAAQRSIVLLQNSAGMLPLQDGVRTILVTGPAAYAPDMQLANYEGTPSRIATPLEGVRQRFGDRTVRYAPGSTYTAQSAALVPPEALQTPAGDAGGLLAEYFPSGDLSGTPAVTRTESQVYFNWDAGDPAVGAALARERFSVRWTGLLQAPYTGDYTLGIARMPCSDCTGRDSARLYLDDQLLIGDTTPAGGFRRTQSTRVRLEGGSTHKLRIEYRQTGAGTGIEFMWIPPADALIAEALKMAGPADVVLLFAGLNSDLESEESGLTIPGFQGGDRTDIQLPEPQQRLLDALLDTGKPVVAILMSGSAVVAARGDAEAAAVLAAWYPGEEGGTAIAQVLAGDVNPSGRLPVTFYQSVDQLPPFDDYAMAGRTYRFFTGTPLYRFGHGLSYASFRYSGARADCGETMRVTVSVTNTSARDGDEVVQLYAPELRAFQRVRIPAGESRTIEFATAPAAAFGFGSDMTGAYTTGCAK